MNMLSLISFCYFLVFVNADDTPPPPPAPPLDGNYEGKFFYMDYNYNSLGGYYSAHLKYQEYNFQLIVFA